MNLCPVVFEPIYKPKIWGGRSLARLLDRALPDAGPIGESWECADLEAGETLVSRGPAKGKKLGELTRAWGDGLLGRAAAVDGRFPLLIKFLDAEQSLSIQVHPDPETAKRLGGRVRVKHEAWHILEARGDACIYRGLKPKTSVRDLREALAASPDSIVGLLERIPVKAGQTYYIPSGMPHALGAGAVVAEVETPSDVTYRLYDWGRIRPDSDAGLHIEEGLASIRTDVDPAAFERRSHVASVFTTVSRLVECPSFMIEKVRFTGGIEQEIPYAELVCWIMLEGSGEIHYAGGGRETFRKGETVILPAGLKQPRLHTATDCIWLEVTVPAASDLAAMPRVSAENLRTRPGAQAAPIPLNIDIQRKKK